MSKEREIVAVEGVFSKLIIRLDDNITNKLALIDKENNPLGKIELDLSKLLNKFEKTYFKIKAAP